MIDVTSRLGECRAKISEGLRATEADSGASVVTVAVVGEFDGRTAKAGRIAGSDGAARDAVIELVQADSARAAALANPGLGAEALQAVEDAHLAICILKTEV